MSGQRPGHISIWYFIGVLLAIYGVLILGADLYSFIQPPANPVHLHELHAGTWWGVLLLALGSFYTIRFRPGRG
jgi:hypothetical protein